MILVNSGYRKGLSNKSNYIWLGAWGCYNDEHVEMGNWPKIMQLKQMINNILNPSKMG